MIKSTKNMLLNTFDYKSKLSRSNFWLGYLGYLIISTVLAVTFILLNDYVSYIFSLVGTIVLLLLETSTITAFMRRLNDAGINKIFALIFIIPLGIFILLILLVQPSKIFSKKSE